jgi:hypothetical protein
MLAPQALDRDRRRVRRRVPRTILGWGTIVGVVAALACLYLPMPWGIVAALGVLAVPLIALRQVPPPPGQRAR